jgi:DNA-binding PadR family transcriptional regulator
VAGLFNLGPMPDQRRGPRVRRGDVRTAILDVVRVAEASGEQVNGYQVIQQIAERSDGAWRPSPGSVYPTIQQLQDEGLLETDDGRGRKTLTLTEEGRQYVAEHADELARVWRPFDRQAGDESTFSGLKPEIGQVMGAVWQIVTAGSESQQRAAIDVLVETRRKLYGILADGVTADDVEDDEEEER